MSEPHPDLILLWGANLASQPNTGRHLTLRRELAAILRELCKATVLVTHLSVEEKSGFPDTARRQVVEVDGGDGDGGGPAPPAPKEYMPNAALTRGRGEQCAERGHGHGETTSARFCRPRCHAFG